MSRNTEDTKNRILNMRLDNTRIVSVSYINIGIFGDKTDLPPFYRVTFEVSFERGTISRSELWLPDEWNGIFIGLGNGGMAGSISHGSLTAYLVKGYVVSQTDMGTSGGRNSGIDNAGVWKDFGWRSTQRNMGLPAGGKPVFLSVYLGFRRGL